METRANYALIGLFTLAVIAAAFGFVYWFSGGDRGQSRQSVRIVFSGSVSGLSSGSIVLFNGIRVGEVTEISLLPEDPRRVVSVVQVDASDARPYGHPGEARIPGPHRRRADRPCRRRAGRAASDCRPGPAAPDDFCRPIGLSGLDRDGAHHRPPRGRRARKGRPPDLQQRGIDQQHDPERRAFRPGARGQRPDVDRFLEQVGQAAQRIGPLAEKLETLATDVDEVVRSVDRQRVARIVENVDNFTAALSDNRQALGEALRDAASLVSRLNETAPKLDAAIGDIGNLAKAIDTAKVGRTVDNVDKFTQSLGARTEDVDKTIQEARSIAEKLNKSADRVDNVLKAAESFLGSAAGEEGRSTFEEIRNAARAVRELAANLDQRSTGVLAGLGRFTDSGLREYQALAVDGRKALNDISRAFRSLERNPQQFIFGGRPSIPEYSGRR